MPRTASIYRSLLTSLLLVIVLLSGAVLTMTVVQARRTVRALSATTISQSMNEVQAQLDLVFKPAERMLLMMRDLGVAGRLDFADTESFVQAMAPIIERNAQITSLMLADTRARESMLLFSGSKWITRQSWAQEWGDKTHWTERVGLGDEPTSSQREFSYNCTTRPWFQQAIASHVRWTAPYAFRTTGQAGITASIAFPGTDGTTRVIGFDLLLKDISGYTMQLRPSERGRAFVLTEKRLVLGLPGDPRFEDAGVAKRTLLRKPADIGVPVVHDAALAFNEQKIDSDAPFQFESGGEAWWAGLRSFALGPDRSLSLAVVVPEADLLGGAQRQRIWILVLTGAALAFAAWYAMVLAHRYSRPIRGLVAESERIRGGDFEPGETIRTKLREVRALADAHDEMRVGLKTLLKLERDLQIARQIQQNTFPEKLPRLAGFELDAWSEPADETGGDTYDLVGLREVDREGNATTLIVPDESESALLLLADATGHGIGPALSVTQVRAMLRMAARSGEKLESIVGPMNEQLYADLSDDRFITAWFGVLDARDHTLTTFSAGQGPMLHYVAARDEFFVLGSDAPPLGILEELPVTIKPSIRLDPGDLYFVFTDGFIEAKTPEKGEFGVERVEAVVRAHRTETPSAILDAVRKAVDEFTNQMPLDDDRTAILIKRVG
ncbi:MAG: SpoIIE family protein phosphatase [Planctomycetota bacterium]